MLSAVVATVVGVQLAFVLAVAWDLPYRAIHEEADGESVVQNWIVVFCAVLLLAPLFYFYDGDGSGLRW